MTSSAFILRGGGLCALLLCSLRLQANPCSHPHAEDFARAAEHAQMADEVYAENGGKPPEGWSVLDANEHTRWTGNGLQYAVYRNDKTGEVVLAFRGTEGLTSAWDWVHNAANGLGMYSAQYQEALVLATVYKEIYGDKLTLTGHSLGGGLATYAAQNTGLPANVFNPAPVGRLPGVGYSPPAGTPKAPITNYVHEDDPLYEIIRMLPTSQNLGRDVLIMDEDYDAWTVGGAHSMVNMRNFLKKFKDCLKKQPSGDDPAAAGGAAAGGADGGGLMPPSTSPASGSSGKGGSLKPFR